MRRASLAVLIAAAYLVAGCDSQSNVKTTHHVSPTSGPKSAQAGQPANLTQAELIARADPICSQVNERFKATVLSTLNDYVTKLPPLAAVQEAEAAKLAELTPPSTMMHAWHLIVNSLRTISTDMIKVAKYAEARNVKRAGIIENVAIKMRERMTAVAAHYGFRACSI